MRPWRLYAALTMLVAFEYRMPPIGSTRKSVLAGDHRSPALPGTEGRNGGSAQNPMEGAFPYIYHWHRCGRKGHPCKVTARGSLNSARVEFKDEFVMITSRNALKRTQRKRKRPGRKQGPSQGLRCATKRSETASHRRLLRPSKSDGDHGQSRFGSGPSGCGT
jgi:hypothetical protein